MKSSLQMQTPYQGLNIQSKSQMNIEYSKPFESISKPLEAISKPFETISKPIEVISKSTPKYLTYLEFKLDIWTMNISRLQLNFPRKCVH